MFELKEIPAVRQTEVMDTVLQTAQSVQDFWSQLEIQSFFSDLMIFHQKERLKEVIESCCSHGHIY